MSQVDVLAETVPPLVRGIAEDPKLRKRYTMILKHRWNIHQTFDIFNFEWHFAEKMQFDVGMSPIMIKNRSMIH